MRKNTVHLEINDFHGSIWMWIFFLNLSLSLSEYWRLFLHSNKTRMFFPWSLAPPSLDCQVNTLSDNSGLRPEIQQQIVTPKHPETQRWDVCKTRFWEAREAPTKVLAKLVLLRTRATLAKRPVDLSCLPQLWTVASIGFLVAESVTRIWLQRSESFAHLSVNLGNQKVLREFRHDSLS